MIKNGKQKMNTRHMQSHPVIDFAWRVIVVLVGDLLGAIALNNFLVPAQILSGGVTGIAQILHHYFHFLPIGTLYFVFNIPLFILGYKYLGKKFIALTGIAIVGFSVFTDLLHVHFNIPHDPLLISLYGGVLSGLSSGVVIRIGGSMGGTDILSMVIFRLTGNSIGGTGFVMNALIVLVSMIVFGVSAGMYTLVSMFAASRVVNTLMNYQQRKTALIVSAKAEGIAATIRDRLTRGSTLMQAHGTYTNASLGILMCVMTHWEIAELKVIAAEVDPNSFITVLDTTQVIGRFRHIST